MQYLYETRFARSSKRSWKPHVPKIYYEASMLLRLALSAVSALTCPNAQPLQGPGPGYIRTGDGLPGNLLLAFNAQ